MISTSLVRSFLVTAISFLSFQTLALDSAYDCSHYQEPTPIGFHQVDIQVIRLPKDSKGKKSVKGDEVVCQTGNKPLQIGIYDIRGTENDWYLCFNQKPRPMLECPVDYNGKKSTLVVRPAVVIRSHAGRSGIWDAHAHIFVLFADEPKKFMDTFVRSSTFDLTKHEILLDAGSGGRGPTSDQDSFVTRLRYY